MSPPAVTRVEGIAAPLLRENVDTDVIIPSREITSPSREGLGPKAFAPWRYQGPGGPENPDFVLNREPWRGARLLIAGANFGCGSSREMAVWALLQMGLAAIVAPSFGAIFRANAVRNGLVPVVLPPAVVGALAALAERQAGGWAVDLAARRVEAPDGSTHPFDFDDDEREMLMSGLDAIDRTWQQHRDAIEAFRDRDRALRPWAWATAPASPHGGGRP